LPRERLQIVLDENLPWSIAAELRNRGHPATSCSALNATGLRDPEWLEIVAKLATPSVLVTFDNSMHIEHETWLTRLGITLATIDSKRRPAQLTVDRYWRDVIHRHAHRFGEQEPGSWWKYRQAMRRRLGAWVSNS